MSEVSTTAEAAQHNEHKEVTIIINTKPRTVLSREVTYDEVVALANLGPAGADTIYTVTYEDALKPQHEGSLVEGGVVTVKEKGTSFDVTRTTRS